MNKRIVFLVSLLSVFALILATGAAFAGNGNGNNGNGNGHNPVTICHEPGPEQETQVVDDNALTAHLGHGDYLGECQPYNGNGNEGGETPDGNDDGENHISLRVPGAPPVVQLPSGCYKDPEGKWILVGKAYGVDGQLLETVAGNEWHILVQSWKTDGGPIVGDLGTWDFPLFPDGSFGNGFLPEQNFEHQVTLVRVINGQIVETHEALMVQINKETGEVLPPGYQPNLIGGYCGDTFVRVDILP